MTPEQVARARCIADHCAKKTWAPPIDAEMFGALVSMAERALVAEADADRLAEALYVAQIGPLKVGRSALAAHAEAVEARTR